jgi:hypothetical protein
MKRLHILNQKTRATRTGENEMANEKTLTKMQVKKLMAENGIVGELGGARKNWSVELPNDAAKNKFFRKVCKVGGFRCGWGGWVLRANYQTDGLDFKNKASSHHY